jgi:hypothetical protein
MAVLPTPPPDKAMPADISEGDNLHNTSQINSTLLDELFHNGYGQGDHVDSFSERHVKLAKQTSEEQMSSGKKLLEGVQGKRLTFVLPPESDPRSQVY